MSHEDIDPRLLALESALASLAPSSGRLDRDQMLFRAGQATSRRRWVWPCAAAALAMLSVSLGVFTAFRPDASPVVRVVYVPVIEQRSASTQPPESLSSSTDYSRPAGDVAGARFQPLSCYQLEQLVQRWGTDALPDAAPASDGEAPAPAKRPLDIRSSMNFLEAQTP